MSCYSHSVAIFKYKITLDTIKYLMATYLNICAFPVAPTKNKSRQKQYYYFFKFLELYYVSIHILITRPLNLFQIKSMRTVSSNFVTLMSIRNISEDSKIIFGSLTEATASNIKYHTGGKFFPPMMDVLHISAVARSRNLAEPGKNFYKVARYTF